MKLLVTGAWKYTKEQLAELKKNGHYIYEMQNEKGDMPCAYNEIEGVICNGLFLYHSIENFTALKYIQLTSAGFDRVPMSYVHDHGIEIYNARGVYSIPMAEFAISSVLQVYKHHDFFKENQKKHRWDKQRGILELYNKNVCIVGCGNVGTECAKRFNAFGCAVYGVDLFPQMNNTYVEILPVSELRYAISKADIIVLTLPLTEDTKHLISTDEMGIIREGSVLVNIARGAIVDTEALIQILQKKEIFVAMDVFEEEPLPEDSPLWDMDNVIITPHNSFVGEHNGDRLWEVIKSNLMNWSR